MVKFTGRSLDTVKMKAKPVPEGFKIWIMGYDGYVDDWLWHSLKAGPEGTKKDGLKVSQPIPLVPTILAPTFQVPYILLHKLVLRHPGRPFLAILDNLFLNVDLAHALMVINVGCLGTTRKNAVGIPQPLLDAKDACQSLIWNSMIAIQVSWALTFVWQDNNAVLGTTTAFSVHRGNQDSVKKLRRRPKPTSTNARIVRPVFNDNVAKQLRIPHAIDAYNRGMNGVDTANQLKGSFTCYRPRNKKWWKPLFYWLLDTCKTNAYLIWKANNPSASHRDHARFFDTLIEQLLAFPLDPEQRLDRPLASRHTIGSLEKPTYCAWGLKSPGDCVQGERRKRKFGDEVVNGSRTSTRPAQVKTCCKECQKALCTRKLCWDRWHAQKLV